MLEVGPLFLIDYSAIHREELHMAGVVLRMMRLACGSALGRLGTQVHAIVLGGTLSGPVEKSLTSHREEIRRATGGNFSEAAKGDTLE